MSSCGVLSPFEFDGEAAAATTSSAATGTPLDPALLDGDIGGRFGPFPPGGDDDEPISGRLPLPPEDGEAIDGAPPLPEDDPGGLD